MRARWFNNNLLFARGLSPGISFTGVPNKAGYSISPLILSLESAADLQTLDQAGPTFQYIRSAFDLFLFGSMVLCLPVCLLNR